MADLNHMMGNATQKEMMGKMKPKNRAGSDYYAGRPGPKLPAKKQTEKGWNK
jgi:hypothetical protein